MTLDDVNRLLAPIHKRVMNAVARGVVKLVDDSKKMQLLQVGALDGEVKADVERYQNYGFTARPKQGAEVVVLFVGGRRDHGIAIAVDDRQYRITNLNDGEVAVYDSTGSTIVLKQNGDIELTPSSGKVSLTGDVDVSGTLTAQTDVVGGGKSLKGHKHSVNGVATSGSSSAQTQTVAVDTSAPE